MKKSPMATQKHIFRGCVTIKENDHIIMLNQKEDENPYSIIPILYTMCVCTLINNKQQKEICQNVNNGDL